MDYELESWELDDIATDRLFEAAAEQGDAE